MHHEDDVDGGDALGSRLITAKRGVPEESVGQDVPRQIGDTMTWFENHGGICHVAAERNPVVAR